MNQWLFPCISSLIGCSVAAQASSYEIVPGKALGSISIGMTEEQVHSKLKTPSDFQKAPDGTLVEIWFGKHKRSGKGEDHYLYRDYVAIYYRDERVVQIEATSKSFTTSAGLSTKTPVSTWRSQYPGFKESDDFVKNLDPRGIPAVKHLVFYGDNVKSGLAWKQGEWGNAWPQPGPNRDLESVIVHKQGIAVIKNPLDVKPYSGTKRG